MKQERIKALPVVDAHGVVVGIVSLADFVRQAAQDVPEGVVQRIRHLVTGRTGQSATVHALMDSTPQVVAADCLLVDLVPLFSAGGCHHLPVVDAQRKLAGIVTQTDLIRALSAAISVPAQRVGG